MSSLRLILADQLDANLASLRDAVPGRDVILMAEVMGEAGAIKHHKKKIAFLFAAMRHFADALRDRGFTLRYVRLNDPANRQTLAGEVARALEDFGCDRLVLTEPGDYRLRQEMNGWCPGLAFECREDDRFVASHAMFAAWADGKKQLRMEFFYRDMRRLTGLLIEADGTPSGGQWNFDQDNRRPLRHAPLLPARPTHPRSSHLAEVMALVEARFADHFGDLEPFHLAVTRQGALIDLDHFITHLLPQFGDYQDAMHLGEPFLFHSTLSAYLNAGLLRPLELCQAAQQAWRQGRAPINAVEGFIRQIIGWREYVRGIYWRFMPDYAAMNHLGGDRPLPEFYWSAATAMTCVKAAVTDSWRHGYSHHIQRLMVTGNFALLAGIAPGEVCEWYLLAYCDAYDWVELPNTLGMALYGDGGIMASKPYAASGKYISRMSNFCSSCRYDPEETLTPAACPFNALYWDFVDRNQGRLQKNQRMANIFASWRRMSAEKQAAIRDKAAQIFALLDSGAL